MTMFCYQCEQTARGTGCNISGVCGKNPEVAALQDLLLHATKGLGRCISELGKKGVRDRDAERFLLDALFATVTNVDFDPARLEELIGDASRIGQQLRQKFAESCGDDAPQAECQCGPNCRPADTREGLVAQAAALRIDKRIEKLGEDVTGLQELITYGLKGAAAYAHHAHILGVEDDQVLADFADVLSFLFSDPTDIDELTAKALAVGELNLRVMELLDRANTDAYGHPEPTEVKITPIPGKCILVSGHDLKDLEELLKQTEGRGINIYTHSEMLPANAYPGLKKYEHLAGNYGSAWQNQREEFEKFPGAILMTTNCIQKPAESYIDRIFTCGLVGFPGVKHIPDRDFTPVIETALAAEGFTAEKEEKTITIGFARNTVMSVAETVIEAVQSGAIKHFFLVGGCDGAKPGRNYYTELAEKIPDDCVILTLACGKYRFNTLDLGDIGGIPRLLDIGQCNDAHSAVQIALALSGAFDCGVNDLPLSLILSWYEQKAVAILLSLLHLGIRDIRVGPSLPAFVTPAVLKVLVDNFAIKPISTPDEDIAAILG